MYLQNKYAIWYDKIISNAISRTTHGYTEKHHIIPKCLGGTNDKSNIVRLTAREHYICHLLLTKMTEGLIRRKMLFAHWRMVHGNNNQQRYQLTNRQYEHAKRLMGRATSEQNIGMKPSEESIAKLRNKVPWNKGKIGVMPLDARLKISAARKGSKASSGTRNKISQSVKERANQSQLKCQSGKPRFRWVLKNQKSNEIAETANLRQWCKDNDSNSAYIYTGRSDWIIIEKYQYKTNNRVG